MSSTRVKNRRGKQLDFYETPDKVIDGLFATGFIDKEVTNVLEPSAGSGAIVRKLRQSYPRLKVTAVEIQDKFAKPLDETGAEVIIEDFLKIDSVPIYDRIIANPPFSQAEAFIRHCYQCLKPTGAMAFLLRLPFIASVKRYKLLQEIRPSGVLVLSQRPKFGGDNIDSCDYAWILWTRAQFYNVTIMDWVPPS